MLPVTEFDVYLVTRPNKNHFNLPHSSKLSVKFRF